MKINVKIMKAIYAIIILLLSYKWAMVAIEAFSQSDFETTMSIANFSFLIGVAILIIIAECIKISHFFKQKNPPP